jgi:hypothetical protein
MPSIGEFAYVLVGAFYYITQPASLNWAEFAIAN